MPSPNEYTPLSMESGGATRVAERRNRLGGFLTFGVPVAAVAFAGWMLYSSMQTAAPPSMVDPGEEDFRPPSVPDLMTPQDPPRKDPGVIVVPPAAERLPPPMPAQPPVTLAPLPPPISPPAPPPVEPPVQQAVEPGGDNGEAARLAELERQRLAEEERRRWERLRAKQLVADDAASGGNGAPVDGSAAMMGAGPGDGSGPVQIQDAEEEDPNRRFLQSSSNAAVDVATATRNSRTDALVPQGTMIRAILETAIQSDLAGMVRAVTSEDVWSFDGRRVLIPSGTRLIGEYKSGIATGQTRVFIVWTRMLRSDGVSVQLGSIGTDSLGRTGMTGIVDKHYVQKFGSAILLSLVGGATQFLSNYGQNAGQTKTTRIINPITGEVTEIEEKPNEDAASAQQIAAQQISQTLNNIAEEALSDSIKIPPTIHVDQGSRVVVFVRRDLDFSNLYPDPVKEALREIRRERARLPQ